ncbi:hypothetical protein BGX31_010551 [Mortierella sp. GBA43]|nr:hypothetical protein BGX31_010551 [Mortierella sp. GBA43]
MTTSQDSSTQDHLAGLTRLQLQALCVKAGLDSTADNNELRKILREHRDSHEHLDESHSAAEQDDGDAMEDVRLLEYPSERGPASGNSAMSEPSKEEEVKQEEGSTPEVKDSSEAIVKQEEGDEPAVKVETEEQLTDVKTEETTTPVAQRKQFWEAKSAASQSGSSVSKGRAATPTSDAQSTSTSGSGPLKRARDVGDADGDADIKEEDTKESSNSLPTPGTVRSLIGKFAGSAISPPGTPQSKKRKIDTPKSSPTPPAPATKSRKVIKIPAAKTGTSKNVYAFAAGGNRPGTSTVAKPAVVARTRATPESSSSSKTPTVKKPSTSKTVSEEFINRLSTPKKVHTTPATAAGSAPTAPPSSNPTPITPTRPRGPVLSTASRAAQRRNREKK